MKKYQLLFAILLVSQFAFSQADTIIENCNKFLNEPFVSNGQQYCAYLTGGETTEFTATFYGGSTYRIIICGETNAANLIFSLYDEKNNKLFSNQDFGNSEYWDFFFESTVHAKIEARLNEETQETKKVVVLVGFKKEKI